MSEEEIPASMLRVPESMRDAPGFDLDDPSEFTQVYSASYLEQAKFNSWCWGFVIGALLGALHGIVLTYVLVR